MDLLKQNLKSLLLGTSSFISQNEKMEKLKGEKFNLFSILQMETAENKTHSNFIAELLNPKGSHQKGTVYLKLFYSQFGIKTLDVFSTKVKVEHSVGKVNYEKAFGGRIDIYLWDKNGFTICIENKIHAEDQPRQLERYYNHNINKNTVFYLNLFGTEPKEFSKGKLNSNKHFKIISYQKDILVWLENCLKESVDQPILRESIKQYSILIKKLTNTMDNQFDLDLKRLMIANLDATRYIRDNASRVLYEIKNGFRDAIINALSEKLDNKNFSITKGDNVNEKYSQIWISQKNHLEKPLIFGIETFSGSPHANLGGILFIGVINRKPEIFNFELNDMNEMSEYWLHYEELIYNDTPISMWNEDFLSQIIDPNSNNFKNIVEYVSNQCIDFITTNLSWVEDENSKLKF